MKCNDRNSMLGGQSLFGKKEASLRKYWHKSTKILNVVHPFVLKKWHRRLLHSASRLSDEGQRVILPSENVDSIRCPPFCQCTYGPRFSICFCTYKWVNLHSYKKALKCYHIWNCWTQSLWFCPFYFLHKTIRSKICPKP